MVVVYFCVRVFCLRVLRYCGSVCPATASSLMRATAGIDSNVVDIYCNGTAVNFTSFTLAPTPVFVSQPNLVATFVFTPSSSGSLAVGSNITLIYPSGFFATSPTPSATVSGSATLSAAAPGATSIVMTTGGTALAASTAVTVTLTGLTMSGTPTAGVAVTVKTSADLCFSPSVASGVIGGAVSAVSFAIAAALIVYGDQQRKRRGGRQ